MKEMKSMVIDFLVEWIDELFSPFRTEWQAIEPAPAEQVYLPKTRQVKHMHLYR